MTMGWGLTRTLTLSGWGTAWTVWLECTGVWAHVPSPSVQNGDPHIEFAIPLCRRDQYTFRQCARRIVCAAEGIGTPFPRPRLHLWQAVPEHRWMWVPPDWNVPERSAAAVRFSGGTFFLFSFCSDQDELA